MQLVTQYAVGMQYAVGVSAKRSTHTVDLANMGGGDHYLYCKKVKPMQWVTQYAVGMQYAVGKRYAVGAKMVNSRSLLSKYRWWGPLPLVQKGQTPCSEDAVHSRC